MAIADHPDAQFVPVGHDDVPGWSADDHAAAFAAFRRSAALVVERTPKAKGFGIEGARLLPAARAALGEMPAEPDAASARAFFERWFDPQLIRPTARAGFVTGYFEPEVDGSRAASEAFPAPLYRLPPGLAEIPADADSGDLDADLTWAILGPDGTWREAPDRGAIQDGALAGMGLEIAHVANPIEAFFIHVQGSARIRLDDGGLLRVAFAGKSGHPYFPIARVLVERGLMPASAATADVLKTWLLDHPDDAPAVMARNRSFIFFSEMPVGDPALGPVAAAGVPLTAGRSLAVDRHLHTFHLPVYVAADLEGGPFRRLMVAQDTGSAILGPARGDLFFGTGAAGFEGAARVRHPAEMWLFLPREVPRGA